MTLIKGVDASFARLDLATFQQMKALGCGIFIQDCWTGGYENNPGIQLVAEDNLRDAQAAGYTIAIYSNANPWWPVATSVMETKTNAGAMWDAVKVVAVDAEIGGLSEDNIFDLAVAFEAEGKKVCIYTGKWVWDRAGQPEWTRLARFPWWICETTGHNPDLAATHKFGPVNTIIGKQYDTDTGLLGKEVDLNTFDASFFEEEAMSRVIQHNEAARALINKVGIECLETASRDGTNYEVGAVPVGIWGARWQSFFVVFNIPEADRIIPFQPRYAHGDICAPHAMVLDGDNVTPIW